MASEFPFISQQNHISFCMIDIQKITTDIVNRLLPLNPKKIILFGSYAWGTPDDDSDLDIYVVTNDNFIPENWSEKSKIYLNISNSLQSITSTIPTDLIVHTKKMNEKFVNINSSFARKIMNEGKILYTLMPDTPETLDCCPMEFQT